MSPISYNFNEDLTIEYDVNFEESIMKSGLSKTINFMDFDVVLNSEGLDFTKYGKMSLFDD